jgi:thymidylate synthase ThyX
VDLQFTSTLSMTVLAVDDECNVIRLHVPMFVWAEHGPKAAVDGKIEPVFYIDDEVASDQYKSYLLRGATEAACEEAWSIYSDLESAGLPSGALRVLLPMNRMAHGTVKMSSVDLKDFVVRAADHPVKEIRMVAKGYERLLAEEVNGNRCL